LTFPLVFISLLFWRSVLRFRFSRSFIFVGWRFLRRQKSHRLAGSLYVLQDGGFGHPEALASGTLLFRHSAIIGPSEVSEGHVILDALTPRGRFSRVLTAVGRSRIPRCPWHFGSWLCSYHVPDGDHDRVLLAPPRDGEVVL